MAAKPEPTLKQAILAADDLPQEQVDVPEWSGLDGRVYVRTMTGTERAAWENEMFDVADGKPRAKAAMRYRESLLVRVLVDSTGARIFADSDVDALGRKSSKVLDRLFEVAQRLNRLRESDIEELVGN